MLCCFFAVSKITQLMLWLLLIENLTDHFEFIYLSMYVDLKSYLPSTVDRNLWWDFVMATGSSYFFSPIYTMCTYNIFLPSNHTERKKRRGKKERRESKKRKVKMLESGCWSYIYLHYLLHQPILRKSEDGVGAEWRQEFSATEFFLPPFCFLIQYISISKSHGNVRRILC